MILTSNACCLVNLQRRVCLIRLWSVLRVVERGLERFSKFFISHGPGSFLSPHPASQASMRTIHRTMNSHKRAGWKASADEAGALPVFSDGEQCISCWELSTDDLIEINMTKRASTSVYHLGTASHRSSWLQSRPSSIQSNPRRQSLRTLQEAQERLSVARDPLETPATRGAVRGDPGRSILRVDDDPKVR